MTFGLFHLEYSVFLVFIDSPRRTADENEAARERATRRLEALAMEAATYNHSAADFAGISITLTDSRGFVLVVPHEIAPELA